VNHLTALRVKGFEIAVDATAETGGGSNGGEGVAERNLWKSHIGGIGRCSLKAVLRGEGIARVGISLPTGYAQEAEAEFVLNSRGEGVNLTQRGVYWCVCAVRPSPSITVSLTISPAPLVV